MKKMDKNKIVKLKDPFYFVDKWIFGGGRSGAEVWAMEGCE